MKYIVRLWLLLTTIIILIYTNCAPSDVQFDGNGNTYEAVTVYVTKPSFIGNISASGSFTYQFYFKKTDTDETVDEYPGNNPLITITSSYDISTLNIDGIEINYPVFTNYDGYNKTYLLNDLVGEDAPKFTYKESVDYKIKLSLNNAEPITYYGTTSGTPPFTITPIINAQDSKPVLPLVIYTNTNNIDIPNNNEPSVVAFLK